MFDRIWQFFVWLWNLRDTDKTFKEEISVAPDLKPAISLIKKWEGFESFAYKDPVGIWTIGYGTIRYENGKAVRQGDVITETEATEELETHILNHIIPTIDSSVVVALNNNQFCALVSFIYNLGSGNFRKSTLLKKLNRKNYNGAAAEFDRWVYAGGKRLMGLVRRRDEEQYLFLKPREGRVN